MLLRKFVHFFKRSFIKLTQTSCCLNPRVRDQATCYEADTLVGTAGRRTAGCHAFPMPKKNPTRRARRREWTEKESKASLWLWLALHHTALCAGAILSDAQPLDPSDQKVHLQTWTATCCARWLFFYSGIVLRVCVKRSSALAENGKRRTKEGRRQ